MDDDLEAAAKVLGVAVGYRAHDAMAWLGAALIDIAYIHDRFDLADMRELGVQSLGWLELAAQDPLRSVPPS